VDFNKEAAVGSNGEAPRVPWHVYEERLEREREIERWGAALRRQRLRIARREALTEGAAAACLGMMIVAVLRCL
jgi:hypothetical protein